MIRKSIKRQLMNTAAASVIAAAVAAGSMALPVYADESSPADQTATETADSQAASDSQTAEETEAGIPADEWLPIGSIVTVKGFGRSFLVLGRLVQNSTDQKFYDYCGCLFPDGYMGGDLYFFDQKDIEKTIQRGFEDEYESLYRKNHLDGLSADTVTADSQAESSQQAAAGTSVSGSGESDAADQAQSGTETQTEESDSQAESQKQSESETQAAQVQSDSGSDSQGESSQTQTETAAEAAGQAKTYTTTDNVRLRSEASTDGDIIITIPAQRQVTEDTSRKAQGDWIPVIFKDSSGKDQKGWVKKEFLK